jgi:TRAP-type mannitol/chloroaromatic compound transport system substrate-binding protein
MRDVLGKTFKEIDAQNRKDNIAAFQALTAQGIKLNKPSAEQAAAWYERADKAVEKIADEGIVSKEALQELSKHLQDFRAQQAQ